jgi:hypothetical protein
MKRKYRIVKNAIQICDITKEPKGQQKIEWVLEYKHRIWWFRLWGYDNEHNANTAKALWEKIK